MTARIVSIGAVELPKPKEGQWENILRYDRKNRRVILNGVECK